MTQQSTVALILAGGVGSRLYPLTADRAKPAVPFGGKYRIIDFTLSNCLHSGIRRILVLTQYKSHSLQMHLRDGWSIFNPGIGEYVTPVPPQQRTGESWYAGTADAVYQNLYILERSQAERVLVLSGDHIYRMDYAAMLDFCVANSSSVAVACMRVPLKSASNFGIMSVDESDRITRFEEKPSHPTGIPHDPKRALASMGIYVFDRKLLCRLLREDHEDPHSAHDFGRDIIPRLVQEQDVYAYAFGSNRGRVRTDRYWRDVGTLDAYYEANMDLLKTKPPIDLYQQDWSIHTAELQGPPARTVPSSSGRMSEVENVIFGSGSLVRGASVRHSILSHGVSIEERASVKHSILLDGVKVGTGARLKNCIVDKHVDIPAHEEIGYNAARDRERFTVSPSGIVVVPRQFEFSRDAPGYDDAEETARLGETIPQRTRVAPAS